MRMRFPVGFITGSLLLLLAGCKDVADPAVDDPTPPFASAIIGSNWYVSPSGASGAAGTLNAPWNLSHALSGGGGKVRPGDTVWLRDGIYLGCFRSTLAGNSSAPIVVRQYRREKAILDNASCRDAALTASGSYTWFWGFEVRNSSPYPGGPFGINGFGNYLKFINLTVHDAAASGIGFWSQAVGGEVYGCLIYNNGRTSNLDHGIYSQNLNGTKRLADNMIFNQYAYGIHVYGSDAAPIQGYQIEGNVAFNNGSISPARTAPNILVGGGSPASRISVTDNLAYQGVNASGNVWLGYSGNNRDLRMVGNYIAGGFTALRLWRWASGSVQGNTIYTRDYYPINSIGSLGGFSWSGNTWYRIPTLAAWFHQNAAYTWKGWQSATGKGGSDVSGTASPTGVRSFVRPNQYEPGRGHVVIFNWAGQGSVKVDVSRILRVGARYEVRNVQRLDTPVLSGTYGGGSLNFAMESMSPTAPLGRGARVGAATGPQFQAFVVTTSP